MTLYRLINELEGYQKFEKSNFLPELNLEILEQYINPEEEPKMVDEYRQLIKN
ncbi:MAG: hypothetical protein AB4063_22095 [Crocosphaera sp.]